MIDMKLNEIIKQYPGSRFVFESFHLDYCCGGQQTLGQACKKRGIDPEELINQINKRLQQKEDVIDFSEWPPDLLADYIEKTHHRYVEDNLPHIIEKLDRLVARHGLENPVLGEIQGLFALIASHLSAHMKKEELILFPFIRNAVRVKREKKELLNTTTVAAPITVMESEHKEEGARLELIAKLTNNYTPPEHACATWQYTYEKLSEFEKDLHMHIHLENNILFPKALELEMEIAPQPISCSINIANRP